MALMVYYPPGVEVLRLAAYQNLLAELFKKIPSGILRKCAQELALKEVPYIQMLM